MAGGEFETQLLERPAAAYRADINYRFQITYQSSKGFRQPKQNGAARAVQKNC